MTTITHRVLSLGGGVQSSVLLLMADRGELDSRPDVAIFADTAWEPASVYEHLAWLEQEVSIPIVRVAHGRSLRDATATWTQHEGKKALDIPGFVLNNDGTKGMMQHRQCTTRYKIQPMERYIRRELLEVAKGRRVPKSLHVEQWMGISYDEPGRIR